MPKINFIPGQAGKHVFVGTVTLSSGTATLETDLTSVQYCFLTQKDATAVADGVSWSASGGTVTVDSSNGSSVETYDVLAIGF